MKKVNSLDVKEKKILTFACADLDHSLKDQILSFSPNGITVPVFPVSKSNSRNP